MCAYANFVYLLQTTNLLARPARMAPSWLFPAVPPSPQHYKSVVYGPFHCRLPAVAPKLRRSGGGDIGPSPPTKVSAIVPKAVGLCIPRHAGISIRIPMPLRWSIRDASTNHPKLILQLSGSCCRGFEGTVQAQTDLVSLSLSLSRCR